MSTSLSASIEDCLGLVYSALIHCRNSRLDNAKKSLAVALLTAPELPQEFLGDFQVAFCCATLLVQSRLVPGSVTAEMRSQARVLLESCKIEEASELFAALMFDVLTDLGEYRQAIPFGDRALNTAIEQKKPVSIGDWLRKIGDCYSRLGLRDHAAIAYRASVRIFRNESADPRLPVVLLALGNSIRKSNPVEAEALYKEAAGLWESKGQLQSATPAWTNLAIVASDRQRFEEALGYYERVRQVREGSAGTPAVQIGRLYNNVASCYRKMGRFGEAHQAIGRALQILEQLRSETAEQANTLASAFGTKGMILRDEGRDSDSIEWFRRACAEFEKQPNPNAENVIEELEHLAAALKQVKRTDEARAVEEKIESVRSAAAQVKSLNYDTEAPVNVTEGTLLIELPGGFRGGDTELNVAKLGICIDESLKEQNLGSWSGLVRIPECATLICYGPDAQAMYQGIESVMRGDSRFEGALITIRQGQEQRQVAMPSGRVN